jgi:hypothetical protein
MFLQLTGVKAKLILSRATIPKKINLLDLRKPEVLSYAFSSSKL